MTRQRLLAAAAVLGVAAAAPGRARRRPPPPTRSSSGTSRPAPTPPGTTCPFPVDYSQVEHGTVEVFTHQNADFVKVIAHLNYDATVIATAGQSAGASTGARVEASRRSTGYTALYGGKARRGAEPSSGLTAAAARFLDAAVRSGLNVLVSGGTQDVPAPAGERSDLPGQLRGQLRHVGSQDYGTGMGPHGPASVDIACLLPAGELPVDQHEGGAVSVTRCPAGTGGYESLWRRASRQALEAAGKRGLRSHQFSRVRERPTTKGARPSAPGAKPTAGDACPYLPSHPPPNACSFATQAAAGTARSLSQRAPLPSTTEGQNT
jgi:hypothetical protein